jgi:signal peptidase I
MSAAPTDEPPVASYAPEDAAGEASTTGITPKRQHWSLSWLVVIAVAVLVSVLLRVFVVETFFVPSASMEPTLQIGDRILVQKIGFSLQRGDIVVFHHPARDTEPPLNEDLVKRIIGLPNETIWSHGNTVYIDGKPLSEPWLAKGTELNTPIPRQKIPPGDYFMMGDYRSDSYDSRDWGPIPGNTIVGRVFLVIWRNGHPAFHIL